MVAAGLLSGRSLLRRCTFSLGEQLELPRQFARRLSRRGGGVAGSSIPVGAASSLVLKWNSSPSTALSGGEEGDSD